MGEYAFIKLTVFSGELLTLDEKYVIIPIEKNLIQNSNKHRTSWLWNINRWNNIRNRTPWIITPYSESDLRISSESETNANNQTYIYFRALDYITWRATYRLVKIGSARKTSSGKMPLTDSIACFATVRCKAQAPAKQIPYSHGCSHLALFQTPETTNPRLSLGKSGVCVYLMWRWRRDSNSRYNFLYTHFPGVLLKPLGHFTVSLQTSSVCRGALM